MNFNNGHFASWWRGNIHIGGRTCHTIPLIYHVIYTWRVAISYYTTLKKTMAYFASPWRGNIHIGGRAATLYQWYGLQCTIDAVQYFACRLRGSIHKGGVGQQTWGAFYIFTGPQHLQLCIHSVFDDKVAKKGNQQKRTSMGNSFSKMRKIGYMQNVIWYDNEDGLWSCSPSREICNRK